MMDYRTVRTGHVVFARHTAGLGLGALKAMAPAKITVEVVKAILIPLAVSTLNRRIIKSLN